MRKQRLGLDGIGLVHHKPPAIKAFMIDISCYNRKKCVLCMVQVIDIPRFYETKLMPKIRRKPCLGVDNLRIRELPF